MDSIFFTQVSTFRGCQLLKFMPCPSWSNFPLMDIHSRHYNAGRVASHHFTRQLVSAEMRPIITRPATPAGLWLAHLLPLAWPPDLQSVRAGNGPLEVQYLSTCEHIGLSLRLRVFFSVFYDLQSSWPLPVVKGQTKECLKRETHSRNPKLKARGVKKGNVVSFIGILYLFT